MKTLIAIPCMETVHTDFAKSMVDLTRNAPEETYVCFKKSSLIYDSRNLLSLTAMEGEYDRVLWLDSDMVFPPDTLVKMLQTMKEKDLDVLTGVYFKRMAPYRPVLYDEMNEDGTVYTEFKDIPDGLFEVGGCGFGCVLMKTDIIFEISARFSELFSPIGRIGEDISFCWRARQCGYKIVCDPKISLGHVGHHVVTRDFYETYTKRK